MSEAGDDRDQIGPAQVMERAFAILDEDDDERARQLEAEALNDGTPPTWEVDPPDEDT